VWQLGLALMVVLTATNLLSTRSYGEFEFWFASIKVAAIVAFIAIAGGYALGLGSPTGNTLGNLVAHGGFAPFGTAAVLAGVTGIVFSLTGAEIVTVVSRKPSGDRSCRRWNSSGRSRSPTSSAGAHWPRVTRSWPKRD
jgi:L-asparagine transporter-like permease